MFRAIALLFILIFSSSVFATGYTLMTIKQKEKNTVENFFIDLSKEIFLRADIGLRVKPTTWIQAQKKVANGIPSERLLITPITRTEERENNYDWLLPLASYRLRFISLDKKQDLINLEGLKPLKVCALRESPAHYKLEEFGFTDIMPQVRERECYKRLKQGKVDVILSHGKISAKRLFEAVDGNIDDLAYGKPFEEGTVYLASSKQAVSAEEQEKLKHVFELVKEDGTYDKLLSIYD